MANDNKEIWKLIPGKKIGPISFGMPRQKARNAMKHDYREFQKSNFNINNIDDFKYARIYYCPSNRVMAVEILKNVEITIGKDTIFPGKLSEIKKIVNDLKVDNNGNLISKHFNIAFLASKDSGNIKSILIGDNGFFHHGKNDDD